MAVKKLLELQTYDEEKMAKQFVFDEQKCKTIVFNLLPGQVKPRHGHPHKNAFVFVIEGQSNMFAGLHRFRYSTGRSHSLYSAANNFN